MDENPEVPSVNSYLGSTVVSRFYLIVWGKQIILSEVSKSNSLIKGKILQEVLMLEVLKLICKYMLFLFQAMSH